MPDTPQTSPESPANREEWVSVAGAAARLGLSERTVQRRAKRGELEAREVSDEQGKRLLIRLDLPTGADKLPTPSHVQSVEAADTLPLPADKVPTPNDTPFAEHLREENRFLRGVIEQLQRDGAETRQALKRALDLAPKQLVAGDSSTNTRTPANGPQSDEAGSYGPGTPEGAKTGEKREETPVSYGSIADELERRMNE